MAELRLKRKIRDSRQELGKFLLTGKSRPVKTMKQAFIVEQIVKTNKPYYDCSKKVQPIVQAKNEIECTQTHTILLGR